MNTKSNPGNDSKIRKSTKKSCNPVKKVIGVVLTLIFLVGCSALTALNDEEFAESALHVCSALKSEITSLDENKLDFASRTEAYGRAADTLAQLEITERSAPQGAQLRSSLAALAVSYDALDKALEEALIKANIEGPYTVMFTENGSAYVMSKAIPFAELEIEPDPYLDLKANQALVQEAATALGLEECVLEQ